MIRRIVTFVNRHSRLNAMTPSEIVEGRGSQILKVRLDEHKYQRDLEQELHQKLKTLKANANHFQAERMRVEQEYFEKKISHDELVDKLREIHVLEDEHANSHKETI